MRYVHMHDSDFYLTCIYMMGEVHLPECLCNTKLCEENMETPLATWEPVTDDMLSMRKFAATKAYRELEHKLADGTLVMPSLTTALAIITAAQSHGIRIPMAISEGSYVLRSLWDERKKAEAARYERFKAFCADDGHDGTEEGAGTCIQCGCWNSIGTITYQPDAMGYPTQVLFQCYSCVPKGDKSDGGGTHG